MIMHSHPVLALLEQAEEPPLAPFQSTVNALAERPQFLTEILQDSKETFLSSLKANAARLTKLFHILASRTAGTDRFFAHTGAC